MLQNIWDFVGSPQFDHIATICSALAIFVFIPIYRRLSKIIAAFERIPIIETVQRQHHDRILMLEAVKKEQRKSMWPI